jgi:hypothetical protein
MIFVKVHRIIIMVLNFELNFFFLFEPGKRSLYSD